MMPTRLPIKNPRKPSNKHAFMITFEFDDPTIEEIRVVVRNYLFSMTDAINCAKQMLKIPIGVNITFVRACIMSE